MNWFGPPWPSAAARAPVCVDDADRIPTPVGEKCLYCREPIGPDDRGVNMPYVHLADASTSTRDFVTSVAYAHIECSFRQVMGGPAHLRGTCHCCGGTDDPDLDMSPRAAALWVWKHYSQAQTFYKYDDPPEDGRHYAYREPE
jgi:hypothetical protein